MENEHERYRQLTFTDVKIEEKTGTLIDFKRRLRETNDVQSTIKRKKREEEIAKWKKREKEKENINSKKQFIDKNFEEFNFKFFSKKYLTESMLKSVLGNRRYKVAAKIVNYNNNFLDITEFENKIGIENNEDLITKMIKAVEFDKETREYDHHLIPVELKEFMVTHDEKFYINKLKKEYKTCVESGMVPFVNRIPIQNIDDYIKTTEKMMERLKQNVVDAAVNMNMWRVKKSRPLEFIPTPIFKYVCVEAFNPHPSPYYTEDEGLNIEMHRKKPVESSKKHIEPYIHMSNEYWAHERFMKNMDINWIWVYKQYLSKRGLSELTTDYIVENLSLKGSSDFKYSILNKSLKELSPEEIKRYKHSLTLRTSLEEVVAKNEAVNARRSIKATTTRLTGLLRANVDSFKHFITLTFASAENDQKYKKNGLTFKFVNNPKDIHETARCLSKFTDTFKKAMNKRGMDWKYIAVWELHANGNIHYHLLSSEIPEDLIIETPEWLDVDYKKGGKRRYGKMIKSWKYGKSDIEDIKDAARVTSYISKYIQKSWRNSQHLNRKEDFKNAKNFSASKGLKEPTTEYFGDLSEEEFLKNKAQRKAFQESHFSEYDSFDGSSIRKEVTSKLKENIVLMNDGIEMLKVTKFNEVHMSSDKLEAYAAYVEKKRKSAVLIEWREDGKAVGKLFPKLFNKQETIYRPVTKEDVEQFNSLYEKIFKEK